MQDGMNTFEKVNITWWIIFSTSSEKHQINSHGRPDQDPLECLLINKSCDQ